MYYDSDKKNTFINFDKSVFVIQKNLVKAFEFIGEAEGYIGDPENDPTTQIKLNESRLFFFTLPQFEDVKVSMLVSSVSLTNTNLMISIIDHTDKLSAESQKQLTANFANAICFYLHNIIGQDIHNGKLSANGCGITYAILVLLLIVIYSLNR